MPGILRSGLTLRFRCTPTSTAGHAASNCTLAPKSVHGVDQATTGMVRPVHVCVGVVFLQPQSTVLMAYQPGASGVPAFSPTVSPGRVTDPARAGAAVQSDRKAAVANFVSLLFMLAPPSRFLGVAWLPARTTTRGSDRD